MAHSTYRLTFEANADVVRTSLSAVRHIGAHLWLGCDETATLERLTVEGDQANAHCHIQISDFLELPSPEDEEIDVEGITYANHYLWFVGSHSLKRKTVKPDQSMAENLKRHRKIEREENRYTLGRIPLVDGQLWPHCPHPKDPGKILTAAQLKRKKKGNELTQILKKDRYLGDFIAADIPGKDNGFDIEGLTALGDRLFLGLRGPVLRGWAVLLELQLKEEEPGLLRLQKLGNSKERYYRHFLNLGGLGIRDLCVWNDTLLILAGPTMALDGAIRVFKLPLADLKSEDAFLIPSVLLEVPYGKGCDRAEGITLFGADQKELLIVYDAPDPERLQENSSVLADRILL
ncbi:MAG: DUF3616 domain-containing protein [Leptolyngbya sp. SIO1D8]|nr:DUF3616 domain-containing protein [Leptolyngbya sp. SIO1D8]